MSLNSALLRTTGIVASAAVLSLLPGITAPAEAAAPAFQCISGTSVTATSVNTGLPALTARKSGTKLDDYIRVHNTQAVVLNDAEFDFTLEDLYRHHGGTPTAWWRVNSGSWHRMALRWSARTQYAVPGWRSSPLNMGNIPAHGTRTIEVSLSFPAHSVKGVYPGVFAFGSRSCGIDAGASLGWAFDQFLYWPKRGLEGTYV